MANPTDQDALRQSDELFRLLVESVRDYAIFALDPDGKIISWNAGAERAKGYKANEAIGRHFSMFYTDEDRLRGHPQDELRVAAGDGVSREHGWRVRKDGTVFWASVTITALRDPTGTLVGYAKVTQDLTAARQAEHDLRSANDELETRVQQRTADIAATNHELEAFSYSISHDLRAPLRALDGFSKLLLERAGPRLDPPDLDYLERIRGAAQRMAQLTDALLALSRLTRAPMESIEVDLAPMIADVIAERRAAEPGRTVEVVMPDRLVAAGDRRFLRVVVENLIANAWKFTRARAQAHIEIGAETVDGERTFFVHDNGVGFDMLRAERLFTPFQRLHRASEFEGTGIGLATTARIVQRHGGRIWAEASPGAGATFRFTLGRRDA